MSAVPSTAMRVGTPQETAVTALTWIAGFQPCELDAVCMARSRLQCKDYLNPRF